MEYSLSLSLKAIPQILKEGHSAQLGELGTFFLTVISTLADVTVRNIKKIKSVSGPAPNSRLGE